MAWISFVCLLAVSSSALAKPAQYGQYGSAPLTQSSSMNLVRDFNAQPSSMNLVRDFNTQPSILSQGYGKKPFNTVQEDEQRVQTEIPQTQTAWNQRVQTEIPQTQTAWNQRVQPEISSTQTGWNQQYSAPTIRNPLSFDQSYNKVQLQAPRTFPSQAQLLEEQKQQLRKLVEESTVLSEADILCRGKQPETVIPLDGGRRFVVCIDESKGHEQQCPRGLLYHPDSRRCERKLGPLENPCTSQTCYNGGQCVQTDFTSFKCQCAPGFDGEHCELDATVCQTQQPCGQSPDTRCQSFRYGAALQHICILQGGRAYGLTASQASASPCNGVDGTFPLAFSDKGFIMCNGDLMYIESCPGGTVWDDLNKACVWPDMQGVSFDESIKTQSTGSSSYTTGARTMTPPTQYSLEDKTISSYNQIPMKPKMMRDEFLSTYGQSQIQKPKMMRDELLSTYGQVPMQKPKMIKDEFLSTYGQTPMRPLQQQQQKPIRDEDNLSFDNRMQMPVQQDQVQQQQIQQQQVQQPSYGGYTQSFAKQPVFQQPPQRDFMRQQHQQSDY